MAKSGSKSIAVTAYDTLRFDWEITSQSYQNNASTVAWKLILVADSYGAISSTAPKFCTIKVDGSESVINNTVGISSQSSKILASGTTIIKHNSYGTKTFSFSAAQYFGITFSGKNIDTVTVSGTATLDSIPRTGVVSCNSNTNIGSANTIKIASGGGDLNYTLTYTFGSASGTIATKTANTTINWTLPTSLYNQIPNATSGQGTILCHTYYGDIFVGTTSCNFNAAAVASACAPTLSPTVVDSNADTIEATQNSNVLVRYLSNAKYTIGAAARGGATIVSQKVTCGSKTSTSASGTINKVESGTFVFSATDSRGFTTTKTITKSFIEYVELTCNMKATMTANTLTCVVSGNAWSGEVRSGVVNDVFVVCSCKVAGASDTTAINKSVEVTLTSNNKYSATFTYPNLNSATTYEVWASVVENELPTDSVSTARTTIKATPVFDWSKSDFRHRTNVYLDNNKTLRSYQTDGSDVQILGLNSSNGTVLGWGGYDKSNGDTYIYGNNVGIQTKDKVLINGREYGENKLLWSGNDVMGASSSITFSESVLSQPNGIVLVFWRPSSSSSINTFFISKYQIDVLGNGYGNTFLLGINAGFSNMGAKYLYISNNGITGHSGNTLSGTNSGITFDNSTYSLKYVIGV